MDGYRCYGEQGMMNHQEEKTGVLTDTPVHLSEVKTSTTDENLRAAQYELLSRLYDGPPDVELLAELTRLGFFSFSEENSKLIKSEESDIEELEVEYTRLFIGPGQHIPLFASVHRNDDDRSGDLWGSTTGEVKRFMKHYGLTLSKPGQIPDQIAILFEFMGKVIRTKIQTGTPKGEEKGQINEAFDAFYIEQEFFINYIDSWIDRFLDLVERFEPHLFYKCLIQFTRGFIRQERDLLKN